MVLVTVILATMASYAIARMHWKLANLTHSIFLLGMMIPIYALVIPLFSIFKGMGLLDTHLCCYYSADCCRISAGHFHYLRIYEKYSDRT
ncbi:MAG: hypothetical protein ACLTS6_15505 [Anaerobutyricum sp.]